MKRSSPLEICRPMQKFAVVLAKPLPIQSLASQSGNAPPFDPGDSVMSGPRTPHPGPIRSRPALTSNGGVLLSLCAVAAALPGVLVFDRGGVLLPCNLELL
jgi:hypothetical protein